MNTYVKKLRLAVKTLDKAINSDYIINEYGNLRLNDEIPMDFGGFNNFYDLKLLRNDVMPGLEHNGDDLVNFFVFNHASAEMPLLSFVKSMYPPEEGEEYPTLDGMITQFENNIEQKYLVMMARKEEIERTIKGPQYHKRLMKEQEEERERERLQRERDREAQRGRDRSRSRDKDRDRDKSEERRRERKRDRSSKKSRDDSDSRSRRKSKDRKRSKDRKKKDKDRRRSRDRSSDRHKKKYRD
jgi:hypothetical protein